MTNNELELWNRIKEFQFDKPNVTLTFAKRLARENGISEHFANELITEYRRFIFLCCVSEGQISPSRFVDLVWHLHLTYTRSYWNDLCKNTINRDLHHNPTEGGREEDLKYKDLYKKTLHLYEEFFASVPPAAVWPSENDPPKKTSTEFEKSRYWVIPKPAFSFDRRRNSLSIVIVVLSALLLGCSDYESIPLIVFVAVVVGVVLMLIRRRNRQGNGDGSSGCGSSGCGGGSDDSGDSGGGGDSGCSSGCSGGCGGGGD